MTYVYKKTDFNYMSNATKFYFKKVRTKRTRLEQDKTNYIQQKKMKLGPIYESSVYQGLRKRTYGAVGDHIIRAVKSIYKSKYLKYFPHYSRIIAMELAIHLKLLYWTQQHFTLTKAMFLLTKERKCHISMAHRKRSL